MRSRTFHSDLRTYVLAGFALACVPVANAALGLTLYQASLVQPSCVGATVCRFLFPAPAANLTIAHASCNILTGIGPAPTYAGGVDYFKLFSSAATTAQDFLPSTVGESVSSYYKNQLSDVTLYAVPAGATPEITAHAETPIIAPGNIDEPTCFISGTLD